MKTCGASGPPIIYTCQFVYNFRFALTSKPREIDLLTCKKKRKKRKEKKRQLQRKIMATF